MSSLIERIRKQLFGNLCHYRQHCISERDDAEQVVKFMADEYGDFRHCFAFREPMGPLISAMGELPYDPNEPGDRERAESTAARMASGKVSTTYYKVIETVDVRRTYRAEHVGTYEASKEQIEAACRPVKRSK